MASKGQRSETWRGPVTLSGRTRIKSKCISLVWGVCWVSSFTSFTSFISVAPPPLRSTWDSLGWGGWRGSRILRSLCCKQRSHDVIMWPCNHVSASSLVSRETIWTLRVNFLQERLLSQWESFTIWNAGKQGRKLYRCLSAANQKKVWTSGGGAGAKVQTNYCLEILSDRILHLQFKLRLIAVNYKIVLLLRQEMFF